MSIEPAKLVTLTSIMEKVELGNKCTVYKASVIDTDGKSSTAYVKHLPPRAIFIECITALIARSVGLSTPRPMLVSVVPLKVPELMLTDKTIFFGSEDVGYPSLQQFVNLKNAADRLIKWHGLLGAGCFDEWIANSDRHHGNILFDGGDKFSLIDHSHAIPKNFSYRAPVEKNPFLTLVTPSQRNDLLLFSLRKKAKQHVDAFLKLRDIDWKLLTSYHLYCPEDKALEVMAFLKNRLDVLNYLIVTKLGDDQLDLYAKN